MPNAIQILLLPYLPSLGLGLCMGLLFVSMAVFAADHPDTSDAADDDNVQTQNFNNNPSVKLSAALQIQAGIETQPLKTEQYQAEFQATVNVVDLQPLLDLREHYLSALAEQQGALATLNFAKQTLNRAETLYQHGVNSQRQLQTQQMQLHTDQARVSSSQYRLQSLGESLLSHWGSTLSAWAKAPGNNSILALINAQQALLMLTLPPNQNLPAKLTQIIITPTGDRQKPQIAQLISKAPQGSEISQGETYFFQTPRHNLRTGMHLSAWISTSASTQNGSLIPSSALIWHLGQAGIFLKTAPEQFIHYSIKQYHPTTQGYFVVEKLPGNSEVVTTGAQLLLSQELKAIIPKEDDGDD